MNSAVLTRKKIYKKAKTITNKTTYKRYGYVHFFVVSPDLKRVVGVMVKLPEVAGIYAKPDEFVSLKALTLADEDLIISEDASLRGASAEKDLGYDWGQCVIIEGMDALTQSGSQLGVVRSVEFDCETGLITDYFVDDGALATSLVGELIIPADLCRGADEGRIVFDDSACKLDPSGGLAQKAGSATKTIADGASKSWEAARAKGNETAPKAARALGRQIGKTRGMFTSFVDEFKKNSQ